MKICFTIFNNEPEDFVFDTDSLESEVSLEKFLINKDKDGIYILPMLNEGCMRYGGQILEKQNNMLNKDQRDELKELLEQKKLKDLEIYYGSEFLAKEYLSLYEKYQELKFRMESLEH